MFDTPINFPVMLGATLVTIGNALCLEMRFRLDDDVYKVIVPVSSIWKEKATGVVELK